MGGTAWDDQQESLSAENQDILDPGACELPFTLLCNKPFARSLVFQKERLPEGGLDPYGRGQLYKTLKIDALPCLLFRLPHPLMNGITASPGPVEKPSEKNGTYVPQNCQYLSRFPRKIASIHQSSPELDMH